MKNQNDLIVEFYNGVMNYDTEDRLETKAGLEFFLRHGHQIAYDEQRYDEFEKAFPNFFEYNVEAFMEHFFK